MTTNDDWRLSVRVHEHGIAHSLTERLAAADLVTDVQRTFHDRVIVSIDGPEVFCYAGTREIADSVADLIKDLAAAQAWEIELALERWHPTSQTWEDADTPLPESDAERLAEHAKRIAAERAEASEQGYPEYEVRVVCASDTDAGALAATLTASGLRSVQRHNYLLFGASDSDAAATLADQVRAAAPAGVQVTVEATLRDVRDELPPNPFAILGGLGG